MPTSSTSRRKPQAKKRGAAPAKTARAARVAAKRSGSKRSAKSAKPTKPSRAAAARTKPRKKAGKASGGARRGSSKVARRVAGQRTPKGVAAVEVDRFVHRLPPPIRLLVNGMRTLVRDVAPQVREVLADLGPAFAAENVFARVETRDREVLVEFLQGEALVAPPGLLESDGEGRPARFLRVKNVAQLKTRVLRALVRQAASLALAKPGSGASTLTSEDADA